MMTAQILYTKTLSNTLRHTLREEVGYFIAKNHITPTLAVILIGHDPASNIYIQHKERACKEVGIISKNYKLPFDTSETALLDIIHELNHDPSINGILVQLPLPPHIDPSIVIEHISPKKDVDGFHPYNLGRLAQQCPLLRPCTPFGIMTLLHHIQYDVSGKEAVIVGASNIVGKPMALELLNSKATITICHHKTRNLEKHIQRADLLIVAIGKLHIIQSNWIKEGACVIDVGINRLEDGRLVGDIDFESAKERAGYLTPVPGGVGIMTVTMLLQNTLLAAKYSKL